LEKCETGVPVLLPDRIFGSSVPSNNVYWQHVFFDGSYFIPSQDLSSAVGGDADDVGAKDAVVVALALDVEDGVVVGCSPSLQGRPPTEVTIAINAMNEIKYFITKEN